MTPQRIGRYLVIEPLGKGGLGEVFLAQKDGDPRLCAVKRLLPSRVARRSAKARLVREAHVATVLDHPSVAKVFGAGEEDGAFCIASEYVPGRNLHQLLLELTRRGRVLEPRYCVAVAVAVLEALAHAHDARDPEGNRLDLVHRDLSPKNVMVSFAGQVKVIDFGVARARIDEFRTEVGVILGSPNYVSPEQAVGEPVGATSDLYSFSAVLFELFTGTRLATGATVAEIFQNVISQEAPPPSSLRSSLPPSLDAILLRGLAKDPAERWPSAAVYLEALRPLAEQMAPREELGALLRELFPEEEQKAARIIEEARARFESVHDSDEQSVETRAAFWERTVVQQQQRPSPRAEPSLRIPMLLALSIAAIAVALLALNTTRDQDAPIAAVVPPPPLPPPSPVVTPREIAETAPPPPPPPIATPRPPAKIVPKAIVEPSPPVERPEIVRKLEALRARGIEAADPEMQDFVRELERLAAGNAAAQGELKKVALCMVDRWCDGDRLYRGLAKTIEALSPAAP